MKLLPIAAVVIIVLTGLVAGCASDIHANEQWTVASVIGKHIDHDSDGSYYVITTSSGPLEVNRPVLDMFNQSRNPDVIYDMIRENHTYRFHTYGYRNDAAYAYPIIVGIDDWSGMVPCPTPMPHKDDTVQKGVILVSVVVVAGVLLYFLLRK